MKGVLEIVYLRVAKDTGLKKSLVKKVFEDYFRTIYEKCHKSFINGEDFCYILTGLGKIYRNNKKRKNNENKKDKTSVQCSDNDNGQIRETGDN